MAVDLARLHQAGSVSPSVLALFRGATEDNREGISWTLCLRQARYFAERRQAREVADATVWQCHVPANRLLAHFNGVEHEYVADVRGLRIREAEPLTWWTRRMVKRRTKHGIS